MTTTIKYHVCEIDEEKYPADECHPLHDGGWIHQDNIDGNDYVELSDGEHYAHLDECIMCDCDGFYYLEDTRSDNDIEWDHYDESWRHTDNMVYGQTHEGEGWFNCNSDYVYSDDRDEYYLNTDIAYQHDLEYCERREDWVHIDDLDSNAEWSNQFRVPIPPKTTTYKNTFGMEYTFGVEIETCEGDMDYQSDLSLSSVADGSINGMEYVTGVLKGDEGLKMLKSICHKLQEKDCYVDKSCGLHVHIGGANFNRKFSILSLMLGQILQDEIFTMMPKSRSTGSYCYKIKDKYKNIKYINKKSYPRTHNRTLKLLAEYVYQDSSEFDSSNNKNTTHPYGRYHSSRYTWLNLNNCSYKFSPDTIEFRCHSGTVDYMKIYNWILICMCFVRYIENNPRKIIESWKVYQGMGESTLCLRDIVVEGIKNPDEAMKLLKYIDTRKDKFVEN